VAGNSLEGLLSIPQQMPPQSGSFDTRPKRVEAWVAALPMAHVGESARRLYTALREMNRLTLSAQDRLKNLEILRAPHYQIAEALKRHYTNQPLPLSPKNHKVAELAIQLNSEMAMGYKSVIEDTLGRSGFSRLKAKVLTTAVHRSIRYLSNVLLGAYQLYIHHPENTWLELNRLYLFAEEHQLHKKLVKDHVVDEALLDSTIADNYKQILLLALANPYRLRQPIMEAVYLALRDWAPHCHIQPFKPCAAGDSCTSINLNTDAAPGFFIKDNNADPQLCRTIDTSDLIRQVGDHMLPHGNEGIPQEVLKRLIQAWNGKSHRAFSRTPRNDDITITLGLSATHHYIDEVLRPLRAGSRSLCAGTIDRIQLAQPVLGNPDDSMELDRPAMYTSTPVFGISNIDDHTPDVWDPDYTYRATNPSYSMTAREEDDQRRKEALFSPVNCKGINESAGGYSLLGRLEYDADSRRVQVGELVGLNEPVGEEHQFSIGVIRRIKSWNNGLELGIQKLAPCAEAIATAVPPKDGEEKKYNRSLILPELGGIDQPATIVTHAWQREGDLLITNIHGQKAMIELTRMLESTGVFAQFQFHVLEDDDRPRKTPVDGENNDEFESVWSTL